MCIVLISFDIKLTVICLEYWVWFPAAYQTPLVLPRVFWQCTKNTNRGATKPSRCGLICNRSSQQHVQVCVEFSGILRESDLTLQLTPLKYEAVGEGAWILHNPTPNSFVYHLDRIGIPFAYLWLKKVPFFSCFRNLAVLRIYCEKSMPYCNFHVVHKNEMILTKTAFLQKFRKVLFKTTNWKFSLPFHISHLGKPLLCQSPKPGNGAP